MSADNIKSLKKLCREAELELIEYPDGRILVIGGLVNVHWWPNSRRQTAYVEWSSKGRHYSTPRNVVNLATKGEA